MSDAKSPLSRLVLFMAILAAVGSVVAGVHYYAVDLPQQKIGQAPANTVYVGEFKACMDECMLTNCREPGCDYIERMAWRARCTGICGSE